MDRAWNQTRKQDLLFEVLFFLCRYSMDALHLCIIALGRGKFLANNVILFLGVMSVWSFWQWPHAVMPSLDVT